ncbi:MAG: DUF937 domain-containing protein [Acidobacteria bacterium]|jgi:hypothetical protein|nr:DUF937 domain-containing protein [Acidobacteriota bacterium]
MNILETILNAQGGGAVKQMGQQLGLGDDQAASVLSALVPALASGVQRNAQAEGGLEALLGALTRGSHAQYLDQPASLGSALDDGNGILGHIFGSKEVSRQVAARAASQTGLEASILKQALPMVAAMMMGAMAKQGSGGPLASSAGSQAGGGLLSMLTPMLDQNRDGSVVDDVLGMLGKFGR